MALSLLAANNAQSVLSAGISSSATTLTVNTGTGALFPSPVSGTSYFKLTLVDAPTGTITEIVHVTARAGDSMTIARAQEGTTARAWSANDIVANMMTAGTLALLAQTNQSLQIANNLGEIAAGGSTAIAATLANLGFLGGNTVTGSGYSLNYFKIPVSTPSGLVTKIIQYGVANSNGTNDQGIGFAIPFPNAVRTVIVSPNYTATTGIVYTASATASNSLITIRCNNIATIYWLAIGD